ncbi:hypothetical protein GF324_14005 [bacterium]|nr:hypothetical protein [bacterium]
MIRPARIRFSLFVGVLMIVFAWIAGCDNGGGGVNPNESPNVYFTVEVEPEFIEAGEEHPVLPRLKLDAAWIQNAEIRLYAFGLQDSSDTVAVVRPEYVRIDSTRASRTVPDATIQGLKEGGAVVRAVYLDENRRTLATAEDTVFVAWSLHYMDFTIENNEMVVGDQPEIYCYVYRGTQEDPVFVDNKEITFSSYVPNYPDVQAGYYVPSNTAISSSNAQGGMSFPHYFHATEASIAVLEAEYRNALGEVAARDTIVVHINEPDE